jgi:hypothetical protein
VAEEPEIKREIQMKWWCRLIFDEAEQAAARAVRRPTLESAA